MIIFFMTYFIKVKLENGEICKGTWSVTQGFLGSNKGSLLETHSQILSIENSGGTRGWGMVICNINTTLEMEFIVGRYTSHGFGIAKDSRGNIFKVLF